MSRQIKCTKCGNWNNETLINCESCNNSLHQTSASKKEESNKYKEFAEKLKGQSDWIDKFFERAKTGNIFMKGFAYFLQTIWLVFFGVLLFFAWICFIIGG